ncbi:MAG: DNA gyrase inhibitor YacG [Planctomycetia bacterium]|nr:DNA gyrase inhibitor YacG [Planctomycetia bacterium]
MSLARCPTCKRQFDPQASRAMPFCSDRCRRIDLNRWLNEEISIPVSEEEIPEHDRSQPPDDEDQD